MASGRIREAMSDSQLSIASVLAPVYIVSDLPHVTDFADIAAPVASRRLWYLASFRSRMQQEPACALCLMRCHLSQLDSVVLHTCPAFSYPNILRKSSTVAGISASDIGPLAGYPLAIGIFRQYLRYSL